MLIKFVMYSNKESTMHNENDVNHAETLTYGSEKGQLPVQSPLDPCTSPHDAETFSFTSEDGACDDGVN